MNDPRLIVIKVEYERSAHNASLGWIAPELAEAGLTLVEDHLDDERPSRCWTGILDGSTFERFAKAWRLGGDNDGRGLAGSYGFDGMNWERDGESPIVCVSLKVFSLPRALAEAGRPRVAS